MPTSSGRDIRFVMRWALTGGYVAAIAWLSLTASPNFKKFSPDFLLADKLAHFLMYGGLAAMLSWAARGRVPWLPASAAAYGVLMEILQWSCTGGVRAFEWGDMAANAAGAAAPWLFACVARRFAGRGAGTALPKIVSKVTNLDTGEGVPQPGNYGAEKI